MQMAEMDKSLMLQAFDKLDQALSAVGVSAVLRVIGGAVIALEYSSSRVTQDVDALFDNYDTVMKCSRLVANELGLPANWLNSQIHDTGFDAADDPNSYEYEIGPNLTLLVPSAQYMLYTKISSPRRSEKDLSDAVEICRKIGLTNEQEIEESIKPFSGPLYGVEELFVEDIADEI